MPDLEHDGWGNNKPINLFGRILSIGTGVMTVGYSAQDVRRMFTVNEDDELEINDSGSLDTLPETVLDALESMHHTERVGNLEIDIDPSASISVLFSRSQESRDLRARLFLAYDLRDADPGAQILGMITCCRFTRAEQLLTERYTASYISQHRLPPLQHYLFVDLVVSRRRPIGGLLFIQAYAYAVRTRLRGVAMVAVTSSGRRLGENMGCRTHSYRESGAQRTLCYLPAGELNLELVVRKLNIGAPTRRVLTSTCSRFGLQQRNSNALITRC